MQIVAWNVNGLRACRKKGYARALRVLAPDVICLQEVRALPEELPRYACGRGMHAYFAPAEKKGYSGVAIASRAVPDDVHVGIGEPEFDREGRTITARFGDLHVVSTYVPKGSGKERDNSRVPHKLAYSRALFARLEALREGGGRVVVLGDYNTAPLAIDLARPKGNEKTSGFLPEERAEMARLFALGWVDTFRRFEKGGGHYTWWSQRFGVRAKNIGWRIDLALASPGAAPFLRAASIAPRLRGSDHCPITVTLDDRVLEP